ncbi:type II toxin-antitoxin system RelB/DinJ family antitoxin [Enorma phocaeensis]|uniref:type II toxin-antitoxin system RelB/DinJ family antitoxin n=1 Tax=Enorma phocaeensis TaxID=1871019 RepID=UPI00195D5E93|nr:type II toxin-antitoxin system RelB/DinJ family antitoxin [Enorma phocaeensis]MBM6952542.1 type II toxin-antitoxin system RelB/DinJ family antitoxin [Enorma phocaeensis]
MTEHMTPVVAKVLPEEKAAFATATRRVGTTPSNAIRMFIAAFNRCGTFPFDISPAGAFGPGGSEEKPRDVSTAA